MSSSVAGGPESSSGAGGTELSSGAVGLHCGEEDEHPILGAGGCGGPASTEDSQGENPK